MYVKKILWLTCAGLLLTALAASCLMTLASEKDLVRIKDIARVEGVRSNQLIGYGLVVGLSGTGDSRQAIFTVQSISNMLSRFGITVSPEEVRVRNVAAVMVTADLPAFVRPGDRIDVVLSSLGDARSLQGGTLLMTPLQGADGEVYAVAQGPISVGGLASSGAVGRNFSTVARIPGGAVVEKEVRMEFLDEKTGEVVISLDQPDFTTAARVSGAINSRFGQGISRAVDAGSIRVKLPEGKERDIIGFVAEIEELGVSPDAPARVVINERTATVVIGGEVRILPVVISHGNLRVRVGEGDIEASGREGGGPLISLRGPDTVQALVQALNAAGASPKDVIAVIQAIQAAGALQAALEVI